MLSRSATLNGAQFCVAHVVNWMTGSVFGCRTGRVLTANFSWAISDQVESPTKVATENQDRQSQVQNLESLRASGHRNFPLDPGRVHTCGTSLHLRTADRLPDAVYLV